ncbi:MAG: hypothetical protein EBR82_25400 [Caulobacteraceae bacterium]|nr:hypothetical protein [Caulobacteraceae bacterium]
MKDFNRPSVSQTEFRNDGDDTFVGVMSKRAPDRLPAGLVEDAKNMVFRRGLAETRPGVRTPAQLNPKLQPPLQAAADSVEIEISYAQEAGEHLAFQARFSNYTETEDEWATFDVDPDQGGLEQGTGGFELGGSYANLCATWSFQRGLQLIFDPANTDLWAQDAGKTLEVVKLEMIAAWRGVVGTGRVTVRIRTWKGGVWLRTSPINEQLFNTGGIATPWMERTITLYTSETAMPLDFDDANQQILQVNWTCEASAIRPTMTFIPYAGSVYAGNPSPVLCLPTAEIVPLRGTPSQPLAYNINTGTPPYTYVAELASSLAGKTQEQMLALLTAGLAAGFIFTRPDANVWQFLITFRNWYGLTPFNFYPQETDPSARPQITPGTPATGTQMLIFIRQPSQGSAAFGQAGFMAVAPEPRDAILRVGVYTSDDGTEWVLLATRDAVYRLRDDRAAQRWELPVTLDTVGDFVQYANRVLLFRRNDAPPLIWDGEGEWQVLAQDEGDIVNVRVMPNASTAEVIANRLALPYGRDFVVLTDILGFQYDATKQIYAINQGADDSLVRIVPYTQQSLLCFKTRSIYLLNGLEGGLDNVTVTELSRGVGLIAPKAVAAVGPDMYFLTHAGVYRVQQVATDRYAAGSAPVSDPIERFFETRVNWRAVGGALALAVGEYLYWALPIDDSTTNNALLLYNLVTQQWEGYHTLPGGYRYSHLLATEYNGRRRVLAVDERDGIVFLLGEGIYDEVFGAKYSVPAEVTTRAYTFGGAGDKTTIGVAYEVSTFAPTFDVAVLGDGVAEVYAVPPVTLSATKYLTVGKTDWVPTNVNQDHFTPHREDYAVRVGNGGLVIGTAGIALELRQRSRRKEQISATGRSFQFRLRSMAGALALHSLVIQAQHNETVNRTAT